MQRDDIDWSDPRRNYPEYPPESVVEIRVHGIGGEPPSRMARDPHPQLVTGDETVGVFRARDPVVPPPASEAIRVAGDDEAFPTGTGDPEGEPLHVREVMSWGGQTSGTWRHGLWVLLLPFAVFNVAGRMHLEGSRGTAHRRLCRMLALTLTLTSVGAACALGLDLVAMQCGTDPACLDGGGTAGVLMAPFRTFAQFPAGRLALGAVLPSVVLIVMWLASRYKMGGLEQDTRWLDDEDADGPVEAGGPHVRLPDREPLRLSDPGFWNNAWPTSTTRSVHVTAGTAWITLCLVLSLWQQGTTTRPWLPPVALVQIAVVLACLLLVARVPKPIPPPRWQRIAMEVARLAALGPLGILLGMGLGVLFKPRTPGFAAFLFAVGLALVGVWGMRGALLPALRGERPRDPDTSMIPNVALVAGAMVVGIALPAPGAWTTAVNSPRSLATVSEVMAQWTAWLPPAFQVDAMSPGSLVSAVQAMLGAVFVPPYLPFLALGTVQVVLIALLAAASFARETPALRPDAGQLVDLPPIRWNAGAVVLALMSLFVTVAVAAGFNGTIADLLGQRLVGYADPATSEAARTPLYLVNWMAWTAKVLLVFLLAAGAAVGLVSARSSRRRFGILPPRECVEQHTRRVRLGPDAQEPTEDPDQRTGEQLDDIGRMWTTQWQIRRAGDALLWVVGVGVVAALAFIWEGARGGLPFGVSSTGITSLSLIVVSLLPVAGFYLLRRSLTERATRRQVARLWDVLTFWPRVTHPLAPPCYAETLVPRLTRRVTRLARGSVGRREEGGHVLPRGEASPFPVSVILGGHSQGSVIALAAAAQLQPGRADAAVDRAERDRVALVTWGSPIAILYERWFGPTFRRHVGGSADDVYEHVLERVRDWHHVFAMTEPFAVPFWRVREDGPAPDGAFRCDRPSGPITQEQHAQGWPVGLRAQLGVTGSDCPVCGSLTDPRRTPSGDVVRRRTDLLIHDPEVWERTDHEVLAPGGHGVYRDNADLDHHLYRIACNLRFSQLDATDGGGR